MKVNIIDDWFDTLRGLPCFEKLDGHDVTVFTDHVKDPATLAERLQDAECLVLFRERTKITADLADRLANLKLISQRSSYTHIDVDALTRNDILLCSDQHTDAPSYTASELTLALMLAGARDLYQQMVATKAGRWQTGVGKTLRGRTLGLYGYGRIAKVVAGYARALGMEVRWWASDAGRERARTDGERVPESREAFFATSDVVSIHVRLREETRGIVTREDLAAMGEGAIFVNTSRSGLVEDGALLDALNAGRPGTAAVDVFDVEPLTDPEDPLLSHPRLIATPHIGYVTEDEFDLQFSDIFDQVNAYARGEPIHMINPEVWERRS